MADPSPLLKYRWKILAALIAAVLLLILFVRWWRGPEVLFDKVVRRDFVQSVVATGHVETPHRVDVGVQITGTVVRIPVSEGQNVKLGDVLIELDPAELRASEQQAGIAERRLCNHRQQILKPDHQRPAVRASNARSVAQ